MTVYDLKPGDVFRYVTADIGLMWYPEPGKKRPEGTNESDLHWSDPNNHQMNEVTLVSRAAASELPKPDMVNAPSHYTRLKPEPMQVIEAWELDFQLGSALKYLARAGHKGGPEDEILDLKKSVSFINRRIQRLEAKLVK